MPSTTETGDAPEATAPSRARIGRLLLAAAGGALVVLLVRRVGASALSASLAAVGPRLAAYVALYTLAQLAFCLGWRAVIEPVPGAREIPRLFSAYLAGDCLNYVSPGNIGGEPVRAALLARRVPANAAAVSVAVHKHAELTAQCVFLTAGLSVILATTALTGALAVAAAVGLGLMFAFLVLLTAALASNRAAPVLDRLSKSRRQIVARAAAALVAFRAEIASFYSRGRARFASAVALCFVGWCGGLLETFLVMRRLAPRSRPAGAITIEILAMLVNSALLVVPARIGTAEGARIAAGVFAGLPPASAAAYAIVRRAREVVWALIGAVALVAEGARPGGKPGRIAP